MLRWAADVSRGNAMYVRELVRGAVDSGHLVDEHGFWRLHGQPAASASLIDLVQGRLSGLSPAAVEFVELLALGEPITIAEAAALSSEDVLLESESQALIETTAGEVRLAHPLYGEAVRMTLPPLRAARLRRQLVEVLEARPNFGADDALRVARLRLDAGEPLSTDLLLQAADAANRAGDPEFGHELASLIPADAGGLASGSDPGPLAGDEKSLRRSTSGARGGRGPGGRGSRRDGISTPTPLALPLGTARS